MGAHTVYACFRKWRAPGTTSQTQTSTKEKEKKMKQIIGFMTLLALTVSTTNAQDRLMKPYLKASIGSLSVEASDDSAPYSDTFDLGGGDVAFESGEDKFTGLDGDGVLLEVGMGKEVAQNLFIEGSLIFADISLDGDLGWAETWRIEDSGGSVVASGSDANPKWADVSIDLMVIAGMIDANYDLMKLVSKDTPFSLMAGLGLGFSYNTLDEIKIKSIYSGYNAKVEGDETLNLAWRINVGVGYAITESLSLNLTYQYMDLGTAESGKKTSDSDGDTWESSSSMEFDITAQNIALGLRYTF